MKTLKSIIVLSIALVLTGNLFGQKRHGGHRYHPHRHGKVVVVKRSPFRPHKVVVYKPYWRPNFAYNRRWVFFPKYNIYWDNWRNHYVFYSGTVWVSQPTAPPVIVNVNLDKEKNYELKEEEEDVDDVYKSNETHKTEYKAD
ncbi:MAG: hypothetical protein SFY56_14590 [Bacteroidota bacterium]|nr:hypothetical protein [Bacteroidota bacterium]